MNKTTEKLLGIKWGARSKGKEKDFGTALTALKGTERIHLAKISSMIIERSHGMEYEWTVWLVQVFVHIWITSQK